LGYGAGTNGTATCAKSTITENTQEPGTFSIAVGSQTGCLKVSAEKKFVYADPGCTNQLDGVAHFIIQQGSLLYVSPGGALACVVSRGGVLVAPGADCISDPSKGILAVSVSPLAFTSPTSADFLGPVSQPQSITLETSQHAEATTFGSLADVYLPQGNLLCNSGSFVVGISAIVSDQINNLDYVLCSDNQPASFDAPIIFNGCIGQCSSSVATTGLSGKGKPVLKKMVSPSGFSNLEVLSGKIVVGMSSQSDTSNTTRIVTGSLMPDSASKDNVNSMWNGTDGDVSSLLVGFQVSWGKRINGLVALTQSIKK
jgi:hypothetical protein